MLALTLSGCAGSADRTTNYPVVKRDLTTEPTTEATDDDRIALVFNRDTERSGDGGGDPDSLPAGAAVGAQSAGEGIGEPGRLAVPVAEDGLPVDGLPERVSTRTGTDRPYDQAGKRALFDAAGVPEEWRADLDRIIECESHWSPLAIGDFGASIGLGQLWHGWAWAGENLLDPVTNVIVAVRVRELRGRFGGGGGWTCADLLGIE